MTHATLSQSGHTLLRRRDLLGHTISGLSGIALASLLKQDGLLGLTKIGGMGKKHMGTGRYR